MPATRFAASPALRSSQWQPYLTVAVGIGANATVFSFVNALVIRPAPGVANPTTLVSIFTSDPPVPVVFYPIEQQPSQRVIVVARTAGDPARIGEAVRRAVAKMDSTVAVFRTVTLEAHLAEALATNRLTAALVGVCGVRSEGVRSCFLQSCPRRRTTKR